MIMNKKIIAPIVMGCLLLLAMGQVHAQDQDFSVLLQQAERAGIAKTSLEALRTKGQEGGISESQLSQILESALELSNNGLGGEIAINKALEGLSKGVPASRIAPAVQQVQQNMVNAVKVVDPWLAKIGRAHV